MVRQAIVLSLLLAGRPEAAFAQVVPATDGIAADARPSTTLGAALAQAGVDTDELTPDDLAREVLDVTIEREDSTVLLACYERGNGEPASTIRVMVRDGAQKLWRSAAIDAVRANAGAVTQVRRAGAFTLVDTRRDAATAVLLILDASLQLTGTIPGHLLAPLPDGAVLVQENTPQYSPTRPVFVAVFVPGENTIHRIHPLEPTSSPRERFIQRISRKYRSMGRQECDAAGHRCDARLFDGAVISDVRLDPRGTRIAWIERLGPSDGTDSPDLRAHVVVSCDRVLGGTSARCRERAFGTYDGPDGKRTQEVLDTVLAARVR